MALEALWLQAVDYPARLDRALIELVGTEGVVDPFGGALAVQQRSAGANMSVDVAAGMCLVTGDDQADQGRYACRNTATVNVTIAAAPASGTRTDIVVGRVRDSSAVGAVDGFFIEVVTGSGTAGAVPATPNTAIKLAEVTVPAGAASITTARITDTRRPATAPLGVPRGIVTHYWGSTETIPAGFQLADGTNGTPNALGRFLVGAGGSYAVGDVGGAASVTLTAAQIPGHVHAGPSHVHSGPSHTHGAGTLSVTGGEHSHRLWTKETTSTSHDHTSTQSVARGGPGTNVLSLVDTYISQTASGHAHTVGGSTAASGTDNTGASGTGNTGTTGGGGSHENRPPFLALLPVIRW